MRIRLRSLFLVLSLLFPLVSLPLANAQRQHNLNRTNVPAINTIPAPAEVLGFSPGDDRKLASWNQVLTYFEKLDQASNRVKFEALGKSTMDVPFVMATISSPANLAKLDYYKRIQSELADPRKLGPAATRGRKAAELIRLGKTIVLITCGIHSTEVGSYLSSMLIAHRLASSNEPEIQDILENTIILLVPSLNPDGVDIVKNWYNKTLGTPYEGTGPPELYHKYVGHDNNRDWYAFTQVETKIAISKIHNVWRPQIVHDIHQQGEFGSRLFLPPYMPPVEPNVPKQLVEGYTQLGNWVAGEMRRAGFEGITTGSTYDAWTPARAYSHYHGGVRILSETASARIASPLTVKFDQLRSREGYDPQKESERFGPVWRGGEWGLRDITNYMTTAAFTLLKHASQNRQSWLSRFYAISNEAVLRTHAPPFVISNKTGNQAATLGLIKILEEGGVEIHQVTRGSTNANTGDFIIFLDQPYGAFAKTLLESQRYPNLLDREGHPISPYDVTAHTLPLLYGVDVRRFTGPARTLKLRRYSVDLNVYQRCGLLSPCLPRPIGLYKSFVPSMDEGWTRWILERHVSEGSTNMLAGSTSSKLVSLTDGMLSSQSLRNFNAIVLPDQSARLILNGHQAGTMPREYTGGMGQEGVKRLREFVEQGGTLVCLNRASEFAIEQFELPVRNVVAGLSEKQFFVPGSILRIELDTTHPIANGMPRESIAWVEDSPVFEIGRKGIDSGRVKVIARYPSNRNPLLSGWLLGAERLKGRAALVEVRLGKGRIVLFGFRPQYRAQSLATYPLLFNAVRGS